MELTNETIRQLWKGNKKPIQLYIHSAFCLSKCNYCAYLVNQYNKADFDKYFIETLPNEIVKNIDLIKEQPIESIYYGGGTPNIKQDLINLEPTFKVLHDIKCQEKVIELHYGLPITDETIQILKRENFNTVIICIQTFDEKKIKEELRINSKKNDLNQLVAKFRAAEINVGIDLIAFPDDPERTIKDLEIISQMENKPDVLNISPLYQDRNNMWLTYGICLLQNGGYLVADNFRSISETLLAKTYHFVLKERKDDYLKSFYLFIHHFASFEDAPESSEYPTLGIGSNLFLSKTVFSKIGNKTYYTPLNGEKAFIADDFDKKNYKQVIQGIFSTEVLPDNLPSGTQFLITLDTSGEVNHVYFQLKPIINMDTFDKNAAIDFI